MDETMSEPAEQPLLQQQIYLILATLFRSAPEQECLEFLAGLEVSDTPSAMRDAWLSLREAAGQTDVNSVEQEYHDLFIGVGLGEVIPYASWHLSGALMEKPLVHIRRDLSQLGLQKQSHVKEPEDHIASLCEVMAAIVDGPKPLQQAFFNQHIKPWYQPLIKQIAAAEHVEFYRSVAMLCQAFFILEQARLSESHSQQNFVTGTKGIDVRNIT